MKTRKSLSKDYYIIILNSIFIKYFAQSLNTLFNEEKEKNKSKNISFLQSPENMLASKSD